MSMNTDEVRGGWIDLNAVLQRLRYRIRRPGALRVRPFAGATERQQGQPQVATPAKNAHGAHQQLVRQIGSPPQLRSTMSSPMPNCGARRRMGEPYPGSRRSMQHANQ